MFKKILVPLDGSDLAEKIIPFVEDLCKNYESEVTLLRVIHTTDVEPAALNDVLEYMAKEAKAYLSKVEETLKAKGIKTGSVVLAGEIADSIIAYAEKGKFELVAMTTHGKGGVPRWHLGSVAETVLESVDVPILVERSFRPKLPHIDEQEVYAVA